MLVLLERLPLELRVDLAGLRVRTEGPAEQQDVRLRAVDGVVLPAPRLLDADAPPLRFAQEALLGEGLGQLLGENDVPLLVVLVRVLLGVFDPIGAAAHGCSPSVLRCAVVGRLFAGWGAGIGGPLRECLVAGFRMSS